MKRGEIWTASGGGDYAGKGRPVLNLQDDRFGFTNSVTVCLFTTDTTGSALLRISIEPTPSNGLKQVSRLMADKVSTLPRTKMGLRIGVLGASDMKRSESAIRAFLGLAD